MNGDDRAMLLRLLDGLRLRMRLARGLETSLRWSFYAAFLACVALAAAALGWRAAPGVVPALALLPLAAGAAALSRRATRFDAAFALDRGLELDERVVTALETGRREVLLDAGRALGGRDPRRAAPWRLPREAALLAFALPLAAALAILGAPSASTPGGSSPLARAAAEEARSLKTLALPPDLAADLDRVTAAFSGGDPAAIAAALVRLDALQAEVSRRAAGGGPASAALAEAADRLSASGAAIGRHAPRVEIAPAALAAKLDRRESAASGLRSSAPREFIDMLAPAGSARALAAEQAIGDTLSRRDWDSRYDDVVQPYFKVTR